MAVPNVLRFAAGDENLAQYFLLPEENNKKICDDKKTDCSLFEHGSHDPVY
jgi:hypothetical protein